MKGMGGEGDKEQWKWRWRWRGGREGGGEVSAREGRLQGDMGGGVKMRGRDRGRERLEGERRKETERGRQ